MAKSKNSRGFQRKFTSSKAQELWRELDTKGSTMDLNALLRDISTAAQTKHKAAGKALKKGQTELEKAAQKLIEAEAQLAEATQVQADKVGELATDTEEQIENVEATTKEVEAQHEKVLDVVEDQQEALEDEQSQVLDELAEQASKESAARRKAVRDRRTELKKGQWGKILKKYDSLKENLTGGLAYPDSVGVSDITSFKAELKALRVLGNKYYSNKSYNGDQFFKKLDFTASRLNDLENIVVEREVVARKEHHAEKRMIENAETEVDEAEELVNIYSRIGDRKKLGEAKDALKEAQDELHRVRHPASKLQNFITSNRGDNDVFSFRTMGSRGLSWLGQSAKSKLQGAGRGASNWMGNKYSGAIASLISSAQGNNMPLVAKGIQKLDESVRSVGQAIKVVGGEAFHWLGKKMGSLANMMMRFLRKPAEMLRGSSLTDLIGLAALIPLIKPLLEGINEELTKQFGPDYITKFINDLWTQSWDWILSKIKEMFGIKNDKETDSDAKAANKAKVEALNKSLPAYDDYQKAKAAYEANPTAENKAKMEAAKEAAEKASAFHGLDVNDPNYRAKVTNAADKLGASGEVQSAVSSGKFREELLAKIKLLSIKADTPAGLRRQTAIRKNLQDTVDDRPNEVPQDLIPSLATVGITVPKVSTEERTSTKSWGEVKEALTPSSGIPGAAQTSGGKVIPTAVPSPAGTGTPMDSPPTTAAPPAPADMGNGGTTKSPSANGPSGVGLRDFKTHAVADGLVIYNSGVLT